MRAWVETAPVIGRSDRLRLAVSDLGDRERTDTEWRHNSELLDSIVDTIPVMIAVYDPNLRRFTLNREFRQVLGWTEEDLESGDPMIMCYPDPDYREMVRCYMESLEPGWRDFRVRAKGGGFVDSAWANIRLSDETHIGIGIDMRGRRAADLELRESRERLRLATEAAGLGVFEWHIATDRAVWENPRMYEIFGRTAEEGPLSKAEFVRRVIHPDDAAEFERQLAAAAMSEAPWRTTVRIRAARREPAVARGAGRLRVQRGAAAAAGGRRGGRDRPRSNRGRAAGVPGRARAPGPGAHPPAARRPSRRCRPKPRSASAPRIGCVRSRAFSWTRPIPSSSKTHQASSWR